MNPEPLEILVGDSISWVRRNVIAYSVNDDGTPEETEIKASDGWTLKFVAVGRLGAVSITASADTENADDFLFTAAAAVTAAYVAGDYQWQLVATKTTTRYTIAVGRVTLLDNIAGRSALYDNRSHAKKVLDAIEAVLEGRASRQDQSYTIAGRSLQLTPIPDLIKLRQLYKAEYAGELAAAGVKAGRGSGNKILTRFVNAR
jgi:hypothetical protein